MSRFTKKLDKIYGGHTIPTILAANDEPKKDEPTVKPAEQTKQDTKTVNI